MTNNDLLNLYQALSNLKGLSGVKFCYGIVKNINLLKPEVEAIQKTIEPKEDFQKYEKERIELAQKHAKKKEDGTPIIEGNRYVLENQKEFEKEFEKLRNKHKKALEEREKQIKEYENLLKEEANIKLYKVSLEDLPQDIKIEQMLAISPIIEEKPQKNK